MLETNADLAGRGHIELRRLLSHRQVRDQMLIEKKKSSQASSTHPGSSSEARLDPRPSSSNENSTCSTRPRHACSVVVVFLVLKTGHSLSLSPAPRSPSSTNTQHVLGTKSGAHCAQDRRTPRFSRQTCLSQAQCSSARSMQDPPATGLSLLDLSAPAGRFWRRR